MKQTIITILLALVNVAEMAQEFVLVVRRGSLFPNNPKSVIRPTNYYIAFFLSLFMS